MKVDVHTELFEFLDEYKRREDPELRFTLRKSNVGNKLERGYWFFGNEKFLAVSFWTGVNWQTKLPNISLIIRESDEVNYTISLDVTMSEEESGKYDILRDHIVPLLEFDKIREDGAIERFRYIVGEGRSIESILSDFLENEKKAIDDVVLKNHGSYFSKSIIERDKIGFINEYEFSNSRAKIFKHLEHRKAQRDYELTEGLNKDRGTYISSFVVNNFANFQHIEFRNLPMNNRWIFITGENGSGKTNLLKAIALVLGYGLIPKDYFQEGRTSFEADLVRNDNTIKHYKRAENSRDAKYAKRPLVHGFAAYGVFRLSLWKRYDTSGSNPAEEHLSKKGRLDSLFARTPRGLIELPRILKYWYSDIEKFNRFMDREYLIVQVLCEVVPGLVDVHFNKERNVVKADYFIRYDEDENVSKLTYDQLSSGTKSTLSFVSDIIIRFYDQQPKVEDPAKFRGIVLVDEIDLHLHPSAQKELIIRLNEAFPGIQFIVTTHSPIPLLGAPPNSVFLRLRRNKSSVELERLDFMEINIDKLLPNQLLTSELFGFDEIVSVQNPNRKNVFTGDTFNEVQEFEELKKKNELRDPDNKEFLEKLKSKFREKNQ